MRQVAGNTDEQASPSFPDCRAAVALLRAYRIGPLGRYAQLAGLNLTTCAPKLQRRSMNYYTDPVLLDVAGAVGALPNFTSSQGDSATRAAKGA